jgi:hypothetical protein
MRFRPPTILAAVLCAAAILITRGSGRTQVDPFEFEIYQTQTYGAGMFELEWHNSVVLKDIRRAAWNFLATTRAIDASDVA